MARLETQLLDVPEEALAEIARRAGEEDFGALATSCSQLNKLVRNRFATRLRVPVPSGAQLATCRRSLQHAPARMPHLRSLTLDLKGSGSQGIARELAPCLAGLPWLRQLSIEADTISSPDVQALGQLTQLASLALCQDVPPLPGDGLELLQPLAQLTGLQQLELSGLPAPGLYDEQARLAPACMPCERLTGLLLGNVWADDLHTWMSHVLCCAALQSLELAGVAGDLGSWDDDSGPLPPWPTDDDNRLEACLEAALARLPRLSRLVVRVLDASYFHWPLSPELLACCCSRLTELRLGTTAGGAFGSGVAWSRIRIRDGAVDAGSIPARATLRALDYLHPPDDASFAWLGGLTGLSHLGIYMEDMSCCPPGLDPWGELEALWPRLPELQSLRLFLTRPWAEEDSEEEDSDSDGRALDGGAAADGAVWDHTAPAASQARSTCSLCTGMGAAGPGPVSSGSDGSDGSSSDGSDSDGSDSDGSGSDSSGCREAGGGAVSLPAAASLPWSRPSSRCPFSTLSACTGLKSLELGFLYPDCMAHTRVGQDLHDALRGLPRLTALALYAETADRDAPNVVPDAQAAADWLGLVGAAVPLQVQELRVSFVLFHECREPSMCDEELLRLPPADVLQLLLRLRPRDTLRGLVLAGSSLGVDASSVRALAAAMPSLQRLRIDGCGGGLGEQEAARLAARLAPRLQLAFAPLEPAWGAWRLSPGCKGRDDW